jgi:hypothetical protein
MFHFNTDYNIIPADTLTFNESTNVSGNYNLVVGILTIVSHNLNTSPRIPLLSEPNIIIFFVFFSSF